MFQLIYKYLILNKQVGILGIGLFSFTRKPAVFDFKNKIFNAPVTRVAFSAGNAGPDTAFFAFLSKEQRIEEAVVTQKFNEFVKHIEGDLAAGEKVQFAGMGILFRNDSNELEFEATEKIHDYFPDVHATRRGPERTEPGSTSDEIETADIETEPVLLEDEAASSPESNWRKYAIILAVIAIAAIIYYYIRNRSLH